MTNLVHNTTQNATDSEASPRLEAQASSAPSVQPGSRAKSAAAAKTLFISDCFLPHAGGSRVYYFNLYSRLSDMQADRVTILTKKVSGWREFDANVVKSHPSLRIIRRFEPLPDLQPKHLPKIVFPLAQSLARVVSKSADVIHAGDLYPPGMIAMTMKRLFGVPYLAYCHGEDITLTERYSYQRDARNRIYYSADTVIAACEFARENLLRIGIPESRVVKITPGVDWQRFSPRPANEHLIRKYRLEDRRVLMTVARLTARKGHATVLRALARILPEFPDTVYLIVGKGEETERLKQLAAELGVSESVRFVGYVAEEDLADFYNLCDVFLMMNHEERGDIEGFGMVFLEASAAGKPVIGGRSGGTEDSVVHGTTGFLLDPHNPDELTTTLRLLLANPELRKRIGTAGLTRARAEFSWNTRAERLRDLNLQIVDRARSKSGKARLPLASPSS